MLGHKKTPKGLGNYWDLDKTRTKLFPYFTCHHLITNTNCIINVWFPGNYFCNLVTRAPFSGEGEKKTISDNEVECFVVL